MLQVVVQHSKHIVDMAIVPLEVVQAGPTGTAVTSVAAGYTTVSIVLGTLVVPALAAQVVVVLVHLTNNTFVVAAQVVMDTILALPFIIMDIGHSLVVASWVKQAFQPFILVVRGTVRFNITLLLDFLVPCWFMELHLLFLNHQCLTSLLLYFLNLYNLNLIIYNFF